MSESLAVKKPSPEEEAARVNGVGFAEFLQMTDPEIRSLIAAVDAESPSPPGTISLNDEASFKYFEKRLALNNFIRWRLWGKPDRDVSDQEVMIQIAETAVARRAKDPDYAGLPDEYHDFDTATARTIFDLFYFLDMSGITHEYPIFEEDELEERLAAYGETSSQHLLEAGVLKTGFYKVTKERYYILSKAYAVHFAVGQCLRLGFLNENNGELTLGPSALEQDT